MSEGSEDWEKMALRKWAIEQATKMNIGQDVVRTAQELVAFVEKGEAPELLKGADKL